jgi:hypothetical protein
VINLLCNIAKRVAIRYLVKTFLCKNKITEDNEKIILGNISLSVIVMFRKTLIQNYMSDIISNGLGVTISDDSLSSRVPFVKSKPPDSHPRSTRKANMPDVHNENCHACNGGGELLCCDTCSLVFHLQCVRPHISVVPEGEWRCPYCLILVTTYQLFKSSHSLHLLIYALFEYPTLHDMLY